MEVKVTTPEKLVKLIKEDLGTSTKYTASDIKAIVDSAVKNIVAQVAAGESVSFQKIVTFNRALRSAREHKNPKTGEPIHKAAHYVMTMEVKPALKEYFGTIKVDDATAATAVTGGDGTETSE